MSDSDTAVHRWTHHRARMGYLRSQGRGPDDPEVENERVAMYAAKLAEHVEKVVAEFPAMTQAQKDRVVVLLRPGDIEGGDDR